MKKALLVLFAIGWFLCGFAQEIEFETIEHDFGLVNYNDPAVFDFVFTKYGDRATNRTETQIKLWMHFTFMA